MMDPSIFFNTSKEQQLDLLSELTSPNDLRAIFSNTSYRDVAKKSISLMSFKDQKLVTHDLMNKALSIHPKLEIVGRSGDTNEEKILCLWTTYNKLSSWKRVFKGEMSLSPYLFSCSNCAKEKS